MMKTQYGLILITAVFAFFLSNIFAKSCFDRRNFFLVGVLGSF